MLSGAKRISSLRFDEIYAGHATVPASGLSRNGELHHIALDDFTQLHLHEELRGAVAHSNPEIVSVSPGITATGAAKAVLSTDEEKLQVYDIATMQADWTSGGLSGGNMVGAITIDNGAGFDIVAANSTELTLWQPSDDGFSKSYTASASCSYLADLVIDNETYIACVETDFRREDATLVLFNSMLIKQSEVELDFDVTAMTSNGQGQLLLGARSEIELYSNIYVNELVLINPSSGLTLWKSASLVGQITGLEFLEESSTGATRLGISTSGAMYISR